MNGLCNHTETEDQGILQRGNLGMMLCLQISLPTCTKLGDSGAEKPRNKPTKTIRFFHATEAQQSKEEKNQPTSTKGINSKD